MYDFITVVFDMFAPRWEVKMNVELPSASVRGIHSLPLECSISVVSLLCHMILSAFNHLHYHKNAGRAKAGTFYHI